MGFITRIKKLFYRSKEVKASSAYIICSLLQRSISLITLPLFTRLLSTEEYGISTVYLSTFSVVVIFTTLNLPYGSFSPAMLKFKNDRDGYISAVNTICALFTIVYFIIYFLFRDFWIDILDLPSELMVLMGFEMLFSSSTLCWMGKARFEYKYKAFTFVTLLTTVLGTMCSLIAVLLLPNKGVVKVIANGVVISITGLIIMINSIIRGRQCFNREYWKYALSFNIPLIPYYLSQIIFNQSDRLMINKMTGRSDAAMYGVASTLGFVLAFVLNAINNSYVPWMFRKIAENELQDNKKTSFMIAVIMAILLLCVIALAPEIILVMAGEQYMPAIWVVPPVAMSVLLLFYTQLFTSIEFYFEEKYKLVGASILAAIVNIVLNYFGIEMFGFVAAGYTTLISYVLFALCNYFAMRMVCKENGIEGEPYDYKFLVALFIAFEAVGFAFAALYPLRLLRFGILAAGVVVSFLKKDIIIETGMKVMNTIRN